MLLKSKATAVLANRGALLPHLTIITVDKKKPNK